MSADSRTEQQDIEALLLQMAELADIAVLASYRGVTESEIDSALAGALVRSGKLAGAVILVLEPAEKAEGAPEIPLFRRIHTVRVIEQVKVNNLPDGTYACGLNCDEIKDFAIERLHNRHLGRAALIFDGSEQFADTKGGIGYDVTFRIQGNLRSERRAATPIISAAGLVVTLTGAGTPGEVIYYTTDGSAPVPGQAAVQIYSAPVTLAAAGDRLRAATLATGRNLSNFTAATVE